MFPTNSFTASGHPLERERTCQQTDMHTHTPDLTQTATSHTHTDSYFTHTHTNTPHTHTHTPHTEHMLDVYTHTHTTQSTC